MGGKNSIAGCLGEAFRQGEQYTTHIENPQPPTPIFGTLETVNRALKNYTENTKDKRGHKLRKDAMSLLAGVYSFPPGTTQEEYQKGLPALLEAIQKRYRANLRAIVPHYDERYKTGSHSGETHYHVHFYAVAEPPGTFLDLHPGYKAKREADKHTRASTQEDKKKYAELGNLAYKAAMKKEQDWWHEAIGQKLGHHRLGLNEGRLSRRAKKRFETLTAAAETDRRQAAAALETAKQVKLGLAAREAEVKEREKIIGMVEAGFAPEKDFLRKLLSAATFGKWQPAFAKRVLAYAKKQMTWFIETCIKDCIQNKDIAAARTQEQDQGRER
jgi:hypothetical protein